MTVYEHRLGFPPEKPVRKRWHAEGDLNPQWLRIGFVAGQHPGDIYMAVLIRFVDPTFKMLLESPPEIVGGFGWHFEVECDSSGWRIAGFA